MQPEMPNDDDMIMDHCALECMQAIESKDKDTFMESMSMLVQDIINKNFSDESQDSKES